jgi:hypothetical protein
VICQDLNISFISPDSSLHDKVRLNLMNQMLPIYNIFILRNTTGLLPAEVNRFYSGIKV